MAGWIWQVGQANRGWTIDFTDTCCSDRKLNSQASHENGTMSLEVGAISNTMSHETPSPPSIAFFHFPSQGAWLKARLYLDTCRN